MCHQHIIFTEKQQQQPESYMVVLYSKGLSESIKKANFNMLGREDQGLMRLIKESIYIRVNNPTPNRNIGKFNLSHILDRFLLNTPGLKLNNKNGQVQAHNNSPLQPTPMGQLQGQSKHALNSQHVLRGS